MLAAQVASQSQLVLHSNSKRMGSDYRSRHVMKTYLLQILIGSIHNNPVDNVSNYEKLILIAQKNMYKYIMPTMLYLL